MNRQDNREDNRLVTIKRRTMLVFKWGGYSAWLPDESANLIVKSARQCRLHNVVYIVRCRPKRAPSTSLNGNERGAR